MVQPIISHVTYIAIGIVAILMILGAVYGLRSDIYSVDTTAKLEYTADTIESKILEMKQFSSNDFEAKVKINAPEYKLTFSDNMMIISDGTLEVNRTINIKGSGEQYLPAYLLFKKGKVEVV